MKRNLFAKNKNIRLSDNILKNANPENLKRLAKWLGVLPSIKPNESKKAYLQRIRIKIAREEKRLFKLPNQGRIDSD